MSKPDYQLIEDIDIDKHILATHGVFVHKDFGAAITAPEFTSQVLSSKTEMTLLNKYAENGRQFLRDELSLTDDDFHKHNYAIVLGITGWITIDFEVEEVNKPHMFGDYFVMLPPDNQAMYFADYADAVHQTKRLVTVYRKPWKIFQANGQRPLLVNKVNFKPGHPIHKPLNDGYDKYAVPVYLYLVY